MVSTLSIIVPMETLTGRQTQLLKVIIDEYLSTAEPVGSLLLEKKYPLGVSPATIRNEMALLTHKGFLKQPHTSAGRVPTPQAMKFYISQLMDEKKLSVVEEAQAQKTLSSREENVDRMMREAMHRLSEHTSALAVATEDSGAVWSHGFAHVFENPEFTNYLVCQRVFNMIEEAQLLHELMFRRLTGATPIEVLFGEELGWEYFEPVGIVASRFTAKGREYAFGVVGPFRLNYAHVIPAVRYYGDLMQKAINNE